MNNELSEEQRLDVLKKFGAGDINRADAMEMLGIDWYGVLIDEMKKHNVPRYKLPRPVIDQMIVNTKKILGGYSM